MRTEYNDNVLLTPGSKTAAWGLIAAPDVKLGYRTETVELVGGLSASINRYPSKSELDTDNYAGDMRGSVRLERDVLGFGVASRRDATLVSELEETGTVLAYRQRTLSTAQASWTRLLSERDSLSATYAFSRADYADTTGTGLTDYTAHGAAVTWQRLLDERSSLAVTASFDHYDTQPARFRAATYGIRARYLYALSETFRGGVTAGWRRSDTRVESHVLVCEGFVLLGACFGNVFELSDVEKDRSSGYTLDGFLEKKTERDTWTARLSRQINPSGLGAIVETDRVGGTWSRELSPTVSASLDAAAYRTRFVGGTVRGSDSTYYRIEPRMSWRITDWWLLSGGYRYARQRYEGASGAGEGNLAYLTLTYRWPRISMSR